MAKQPFRGATTAQFYVVETVQGVTPDNPAWSAWRTTGGIPALTRDVLVGAELDGSREVAFIRTGNKQVAGEFAVELSRASQDDMLACAMTSDWVTGSTIATQSIAVDAAAKTFTGAGFTAEVGDLVSFPLLDGNNAKPFIVTEATATVLTGAGIGYALTTDSTSSTLKIADKLETGNLCKSVSILTWFKGKCGNPDAYLITRGVEFTGFTIEQAVNAMVTGSFPFIGLSQEILTAVPTGSTFPATAKTDPFSSVDVSAYDGSARLELIDSFTITNDNETSAQFELGNSGVAFVERGRANNTFSLAGKLYDLSMMQKFLDETDVTLTSLLSGSSGAMSFTLNKAQLTSATPEIGGAESVTIALEGQATGTPMQSSITIQRLTV